jgi:hypothetical protein
MANLTNNKHTNEQAKDARKAVEVEHSLAKQEEEKGVIEETRNGARTEGEFLSRSSILPGVATTTSGLVRSSASCSCEESPPTTSANRASL